MKKHKYILLIISIIIASGCASTKDYAAKKESERAAGQAAILELLESGNYAIGVSKLYSGRYQGMDLVPSNNYLSISNGIARINLAYVGRSFSLRPISAINVRGEIEDISITPKKMDQPMLRWKSEAEVNILK